MKAIARKSLYLVTDSGMTGGRPLVDIVAAAVRGGVGVVQLREKALPTRAFIDLARQVSKILSGTGVPLLINDRVDVALAADADGVHLGQSDMHYRDARRLLGPKAIIGLSVESMEEVLDAENFDVDYLGVSPIFSTPTKTDTIIEWGLDGLRHVRAASRHFLVAIGRMTAANALDALAAGADSVAVVSAICAARDPESAAYEIYQALQAFPGERSTI
ncbi:MAG: thiamine phosphate synthase [bacterium]